MVAEVDLVAILDALPDPVVVHERGTIRLVNPAFVALLGWSSAAELIGRNALEHVHPDDRELVTGRINSTLKNRRTPEHRLVDRHGTVIPVEVTGVPFPFDGRVAALAVVHDLRERKRLDGELAAADRMASLGRLASAVGHEINNPLTYVLGALEQLRRNLEGAPNLLARVDDAWQGATRVRDIVRDLRALSSPADTPVGAVDLRRVLDVAIATTAHEVEHRARLVREDGGDVPAVAGIEGRLIQLFVNLLINAAQAIPDGDAAANEIRVATHRLDATRVAVDVLDTGCGFPADDAARLFEPFYTTKPGAGTGLGLSIAHRIASSFGGSITAERRPPSGACLRVTLLAHADPLGAAASTVSPPAVARSARVRFVDDEPLIRRLAADLLAPHEVVTAASGREAIDLLQREKFDAIACDLQMPELGGVDVYEWLVDNRPELARRILFMTGGAFTERAHRFITSSAPPHVEKPFDPVRVRELIDGLLAR